MAIPGLSFSPVNASLLERLVRRADRALTLIEREQLKRISVDYLIPIRESILSELQKRYPNALADVEGKSDAWRLARGRLLATELRGVTGAALSGVPDSALKGALAQVAVEGLEEALQLLDAFEPGLARQLVDSLAVNYQAVNNLAVTMGSHLHRYAEDFVQKAQGSVIESLVRGEGVRKAATRLRHAHAQTMYNATRIVRTELHQAHDLAVRTSYEASGIEYVQRIATMDDRVCGYCAARAGQVYRVEEAPASLHPHDRCYNLPWRPEWEENGVIDKKWIKDHRAETVQRLKDAGGELRTGRAPFERMNDLPKPRTAWHPLYPGKFTPLVPVVPPLSQQFPLVVNTAKAGLQSAAAVSVPTPAAPPTPKPVTPPPTPPPTPTPAAPTKTGAWASTAEEIMQEKLSDARGSNVGGVYRGTDNVLRYVKEYDDPAQAYGEHLANRLYRELGLNGPDSVVFQLPSGRTGYASILIDEVETLQQAGLTLERAREILKGYAADVVSANWDAVGMSLDNILTSGKAVVRIDNGGAFLMRAQAGRKPIDILNQIPELKGFLNPGVNPSYAKVAEAAGIYSVDDLGELFIKQVEDLVALRDRYDRGWAGFVQTHIPGADVASKIQIVDMLNARTALLQDEAARLAARAARAVRGPVELGADNLPKNARHLDWLEEGSEVKQFTDDLFDDNWSAKKRMQEIVSQVIDEAVPDGVDAATTRKAVEYLSDEWVKWYSTDTFHMELRQEVAAYLEGRERVTTFRMREAVERVLSTRVERWIALSERTNIPFPRTIRAMRGVNGDQFLADVYEAWNYGADEMVVRAHELTSWSMKRPFNAEVVFDVDLPFANTFMDQLVDDSGFFNIMSEHEVIAMTAKPNQLVADPRRVRVNYRGHTYTWADRQAFIDTWEAVHGL